MDNISAVNSTFNASDSCPELAVERHGGVAGDGEESHVKSRGLEVGEKDVSEGGMHVGDEASEMDGNNGVVHENDSRGSRDVITKKDVDETSGWETSELLDERSGDGEESEVVGKAETGVRQHGESRPLQPGEVIAEENQESESSLLGTGMNDSIRTEDSSMDSSVLQKQNSVGGNATDEDNVDYMNPNDNYTDSDAVKESGTSNEHLDVRDEEIPSDAQYTAESTEEKEEKTIAMDDNGHENRKKFANERRKINSNHYVMKEIVQIQHDRDSYEKEFRKSNKKHFSDYQRRENLDEKPFRNRAQNAIPQNFSHSDVRRNESYVGKKSNREPIYREKQFQKTNLNTQEDSFISRPHSRHFNEKNHSIEKDVRSESTNSQIHSQTDPSPIQSRNLHSGPKPFTAVTTRVEITKSPSDSNDPQVTELSNEVYDVKTKNFMRNYRPKSFTKAKTEYHEYVNSRDNQGREDVSSGSSDARLSSKNEIENSEKSKFESDLKGLTLKISLDLTMNQRKVELVLGSKQDKGANPYQEKSGNDKQSTESHSKKDELNSGILPREKDFTDDQYSNAGVGYIQNTQDNGSSLNDTKNTSHPILSLGETYDSNQSHFYHSRAKKSQDIRRNDRGQPNPKLESYHQNRPTQDTQETRQDRSAQDFRIAYDENRARRSSHDNKNHTNKGPIQYEKKREIQHAMHPSNKNLNQNFGKAVTHSSQDFRKTEDVPSNFDNQETHDVGLNQSFTKDVPFDNRIKKDGSKSTQDIRYQDVKKPSVQDVRKMNKSDANVLPTARSSEKIGGNNPQNAFVQSSEQHSHVQNELEVGHTNSGVENLSSRFQKYPEKKQGVVKKEKADVRTVAASIDSGEEKPEKPNRNPNEKDETDTKLEFTRDESNKGDETQSNENIILKAYRDGGRVKQSKLQLYVPRNGKPFS